MTFMFLKIKYNWLQVTSRSCCLRTVTTCVSCDCTPATTDFSSTDRRASLHWTMTLRSSVSSGQTSPRRRSAC